MALDYEMRKRTAALRSKPNFTPRKDKRHGSEKRQKTGDRERNVGHPNGEEHSRVPKGNRVRAMVTVVVTSVIIIGLVADDVTIVAVYDDVAIPTVSAIWWDAVCEVF